MIVKGLAPNKTFILCPKEVITNTITKVVWEEFRRPKKDRDAAKYILLSMTMSWQS